MLLDDEQILLQESANGHISRVSPIDAYRTWRDKKTDQHDAALWSSFVEMGWSGLLVPESHEGIGLGAVEAGLVSIELGRHLTISPYLSNALSTIALSRCANDALKTAMLPAMASGEKLVAFACDDRSRHDPAAPGIAAEIEQGNGLTVSGTAQYVLDGMAADSVILYAISDADEVLLLVNTDDPALSRVSADLVDGRPAARVILDKAQITDTNILATGEMARGIVEEVLAYGRALLAAELLGAAESAFSMTTGYLKERKQFGMHIGSFQALQHRASILYTELEAMGGLVMGALFALAEGDEKAHLLAIAAKAKSNAAALLAAQESLQMHGGIGMTDEHDIGLFLKRIRVASLLFGDVHQLRSEYAKRAGY